jgi:hypothetical protein
MADLARERISADEDTDLEDAWGNLSGAELLARGLLRGQIDCIVGFLLGAGDPHPQEP